MASKIGEQTVRFDKKIFVKDTYCTVGPYEGEGPLKKYFHEIINDDLFGQESYEKAESMILKNSLNKLLSNNSMKAEEIDIFTGGDLLDQITATTFAVKEHMRSFWGLYSACATFAQGMQIASMGIEAGAFKKAVVSSSSHFSSSERQYRTPLELGCQNPTTSQRTVTAGGCLLLSDEGNAPYIDKITVGRIIDVNEKDPFDMGAAMSPAAYDTILNHFKATKTNSRDYDLVVTGDLSREGSDMLKQVLEQDGYSTDNFTDCGNLIYDSDNQKVNNGGSGAGCCSAVFCGYLYSLMKSEKIKKLLFVPTGALLSPTTYLQKQSIPAIAHAVEFVIGGNHA